MNNIFTENDFEKFSNAMAKATKKVYKFADVKDKIEKVAFDVVRFKDDDNINLWQVQDTDDGQVIVAMYDEDDGLPDVKSDSKNWHVAADRQDNINIFYKGEAVTRVNASKIGIPSSDVGIICRSLPNKLASDKSFTRALLNELVAEERDLLVAKYPELKG